MYQAVRRQIANERGIGLVGAMLIVALLAVLAAIITVVAVNERRSAFNEVLHSSSLVAADSGTEHAIAWLMLQDNPPTMTDWTSRRVGTQALSAMDTHAAQRFEYALNVGTLPDGNPDIDFSPPGYNIGEYMLVGYDVRSGGEAGLEGRSDVAVIVTKLFPTGYGN